MLLSRNKAFSTCRRPVCVEAKPGLASSYLGRAKHAPPACGTHRLGGAWRASGRAPSRRMSSVLAVGHESDRSEPRAPRGGKVSGAGTSPRRSRHARPAMPASARATKLASRSRFCRQARSPPAHAWGRIRRLGLPSARVDAGRAAERWHYHPESSAAPATRRLRHGERFELGILLELRPLSVARACPAPAHRHAESLGDNTRLFRRALPAWVCGEMTNVTVKVRTRCARLTL